MEMTHFIISSSAVSAVRLAPYGGLCLRRRPFLRRPISAVSAPSSKAPPLEEDALRFARASSEGGNLIRSAAAYSPITSLRSSLTGALLGRTTSKRLASSSSPSNRGRYSVVGAQPAMEIVAKENTVTVMDHLGGRRTEETVEDPMVIPRRIMEKWTPRIIDELPDAFCGGWVGYFSYDAVRYVEKKKIPFSNAPVDDRNLPDVHLGLYDDVIVFDHVEKKAHVIHWVRTDGYPSIEKAYEDGKNRLELLLSRVQNIDPPKLLAGHVDNRQSLLSASPNKSTMTSEAYKKAVVDSKEHILAGDIFQIVLSQRFERRTFAEPFEVYRALRMVNPSPHMTYLQARGCILVASSPEILTHVKKVTGELLDHLTCWDALRAALPVGTVSGAPKVKAMELIDELEVTRRGPYSGGFGGISFTGDMDIALALRTIVFSTRTRFDTMYSYKDSNRRQEWVAHLQAGAGIVADSDPDDEQRECENKAAALSRAIDLAESAFVEKWR
ncbi:hypothetical protein QJS10_CPA03g01886 [Acorus calamus]|uniref:Anthranilate synthase n=1 Tax=Acorus calamus TaxID=4465 RepID=A0AAV9F5K9_ACOCL|nr:hypothetical protein QJS10_CPA03g01886 [Acorus calamus]